MSTPRDNDRATRWRKANPARAREHCRAYYHRRKMQNPAALAAWNLVALARWIEAANTQHLTGECA